MPAVSRAVSSGSLKALVIVWIEDGASKIARGEAVAVSSEGLRVKLAEAPAFEPGDDVAVRISFERGAPTVATTARVEELRAGTPVECSLVWSGPKSGRRELDAWLARAA